MCFYVHECRRENTIIYHASLCIYVCAEPDIFVVVYAVAGMSGNILFLRLVLCNKVK